MTRFQLNRDKHTPQEWSEIALLHTSENGNQWRIIGGIVLSALVAGATTPLTGGLVLAYTLWGAWRKSGEIQRNQRAIIEDGCVAQVLEGDDFFDYLHQVGHDALWAELHFASERNLSMSNAAQDYFEAQQTPSPVMALQPSPQIPHPNRLEGAQGSATQVDYYNPLQTAQIDIVGQMSDRINNTIIVGVPGSGKGMLVANAIRSAKRKHPKLKIFVIDPKADPKEAGYFACSDVVKAYACMDAKPSTVAVWAESAFDEYTKYAQNNAQTLLICDEGTMLGNKLQQAKSTLLVDKLTSYTSGGDSFGRNIWFMMTSPYVSGASLNLGTTSQMTTIVIAFNENIGALTQWRSAKIFKQLSLDTVSDLINGSPIGRAVYYGKTGQWYMMPKLQNFSGYDRDKQSYLPGFTPQSNPAFNPQPETKSDLSSDLSVSDVIGDTLKEPLKTIWNFAKERSDWVTVRDIQRKDFAILKGKGSEQIHQYLGLLADTGYGEIDEENKSHSSVRFKAY